MLTASAEFSAALTRSHRAMTRAVLMNPLEGGGFEDVSTMSVSTGRLRIDGTRNVWRQGSLSLVPTSTVDRAMLSEIDSRSRIRVERGVMFPDGTEEWVVIGLFQAQDSSLRLRGAEVDMQVADLGSLVEDFGLITPYVPQDEFAAWLTTVEAIQDLVTIAIAWDTIPGWDIDATIDLAAEPTAGTVFTGSRWTAIKALAESLGAVAYAKPDGRWAIRSTVADVDNPVLELATGDGGVVVDATLSKSRDGQYNAIPLRWETPAAGGLVFLVDADPLSPTFWDGPFGRKPRDEESNDLITDETQAIAAATALLDQYKGISSSFSLESVHNPLLEPMDVVTIDTPFGLETHVVDSIDYPLASGTMTCQTRLLRVEA